MCHIEKNVVFQLTKNFILFYQMTKSLNHFFKQNATFEGNSAVFEKTVLSIMYYKKYQKVKISKYQTIKSIKTLTMTMY